MTQLALEQRPSDDPNLAVLAVTGELDLTNVHELHAGLDRVASSDASSLVLDLTRVAFIDSAALHVLFQVARQRGSKRFGLVVEPVSAIARTLEIVGISAAATLGRSVGDVTSRLSST